jgi:hypothetical protein
VYLVETRGDHVRVELVSQGMPLSEVPPVTNDAARFHRARLPRVAPGTIDRTTFAEPGVFYFHDALVSTQPPSIQRFTTPPELALDPNVRPLGISPDGTSFVRLGFAEDDTSYVLVTTDVARDVSVRVPIDAAATRLGAVEALDPTWLSHYYEWRHDGDGGWHLAAREHVAPLPHRGLVTTTMGEYREYHVEPAGAAMYQALIDFLKTEMNATRSSADEAAVGYRLTVDGQGVYVIHDEHAHRVGVYMDRGVDSRLVMKIAERFDAALATGKYDGMFGE